MVLNTAFWEFSYLDFWAKRELRDFIESMSLRVPPKSKVVDIGCGPRPYEIHFSKSDYFCLEVAVTGASNEAKLPDAWFDGVTLPFIDQSIDVVLMTEVIEHAESIDSLIKEVHRVIKDRGFLIVSVPFIYQEHEMPFDFRRFSTIGLTQFLNKYNFHVEVQKKRNTGFRLVTLLVNQQMCKFLSRIPGLATLWMFSFGTVLNLVGYLARPNQADSFTLVSVD